MKIKRLFCENGGAVEASPAAVAETLVGAFETLPCTCLWSQCGLVRTSMLPVAPMGGLAAFTEDNAWVYRLHIHGEGSRSEGLTLALLQGGTRLFPDGAWRAETLPGVFPEGDNGGRLRGDAGWFPEAWNGAAGGRVALGPPTARRR